MMTLVTKGHECQRRSCTCTYDEYSASLKDRNVNVESGLSDNIPGHGVIGRSRQGVSGDTRMKEEAAVDACS